MSVSWSFAYSSANFVRNIWPLSEYFAQAEFAALRPVEAEVVFHIPERRFGVIEQAVRIQRVEIGEKRRPFLVAAVPPADKQAVIDDGKGSVDIRRVCYIKSAGRISRGGFRVRAVYAEPNHIAVLRGKERIAEGETSLSDLRQLSR